MLKRIITSLFALGFIAATFPTLPVFADSVAPIEIDNILDLCLYVQSNDHWFNDANDCSIYTNTQTSVVMDYRYLEIDDPVVFNNLDITFKITNSPFIFRDNGSLTINGGRYTSPSCVLWMIYDNRYIPATFAKHITINSGVFTAVSTNTTSDTPASPVCLIPYEAIKPEYINDIVNSYLPAGKTFQEISQVRRTLQAANGTAHVDKIYDNSSSIHYLNVRSVAVVNAPTIPTPTPEPTPTTPEEPTGRQEPPFIPKAPNTGRK